MAEGLGVDGAAKDADDVRGKRQIQRRQHHAAAHRQHHRVAYAAFGGAHLLPAKADAHVGAAAVTDHHRDGQRHHRERKHHRVGRVAVGAKVAGVRNEDLVHNVVQSAHQQRHDAGHRILFHQLADTLRPQKLIRCFHTSSPLKKECVQPGRWFYAQGYTLFGLIRFFGQYRIILRADTASEGCQMLSKKHR